MESGMHAAHGKDVTSPTDQFISLTMSAIDTRPQRRSARSSGMWSSPIKDKLHEHKRCLRTGLEKTSTQAVLFLLLCHVLFINNFATIARASDDFIMPINMSLIASFVLFCLEMAISFWTASRHDTLYMTLELLGTLSILLEISWINSALGLSTSLEKEAFSKTAIITSRAGRVTRMVRLIRFVRALKIFIMIRRYLARKVDDGGKERSMAPSSIGSHLNDRISLLAAFLVMMTMMLVSLLNPHHSDEMNQAFMMMLSYLAGTLSDMELDSMVHQIKNFIDKSDGGIVLRKLVVGADVWDWYEPNCCSIDRDIVELSREGMPDVRMHLDVSEQNVTVAYLEIFLGVAVIVELFVFVALLHRNTTSILIAPLERIFTEIKQNAHMIVSALDTKDDDQEDKTEIGTIEAAISKMTKLVRYMTPSGNNGTSMLSRYIQDENTSDDTKAWIHDFVPHPKSTTFRQRRSTNAAKTKSTTGRHFGLTRAMSEDDQKQSQYIARIMNSIDKDTLHSWNLDVTQFSDEELYGLLCQMFEDLGLTSFMNHFAQSAAFVPTERLWSFVKHVRQYYHNVPYHNFFHCCDVAHATFRVIKLIGQRASLTPVEKFALMVAAICHDMDHPGLQNSFLVDTRDPLATIYNDKSVLENRHISCLYTLVAEKPDADVFEYLDATHWREVRKIIIESILHTDMTKHFGMVSKAEIFYELHVSDIHSDNYSSLFNDPDDRLFLFALILHCADISNPVKPLNISEKWADNVLDEFFRQGDKEREKGLPVSFLCDRNGTSRSRSQINFLEIVIAPLYYHVVRIFPEMRSTMIYLRENRLFWEQALIEELKGKKSGDTEEESIKAKKRLDDFLQKYKDVFDLSLSSKGYA